MKIASASLKTALPLPDSLRRGVVTLGKFDGVHRGHERILLQVREQAARLDCPAIALTFDPSPAVVLRPEHAPPPLCTFERKAELIARIGLDALVSITTDRALLELSPDDFFQKILLETFDARVIVEGSDFTFGKDRRGHAATLKALCEANRRSAEIVPPVLQRGEKISSSRIRSLIRDGAVEAAREMLTEPYQIRGTVVPGDRRGRTYGYPTANLAEVRTLLPKDGIYACFATVEGKTFPAATHLGEIPTFDRKQQRIEPYLIGFEGDLYGQTLSLDFLARLREVRPFDSAEELAEQIALDIKQTQACCEATPAS